MAKAIQTNGMPTFMGRAPGLNEYDQIDSLAWVPNVVAKTADYTVLASESGTIFTTEGATADVNFTLPAAGDGPWYFQFFNAEDVEIMLTAETADTMVVFNDAAADTIAFTDASEHIGNGFIAFAASGGSVVYVQALLGSHTTTPTVAT